MLGLYVGGLVWHVLGLYVGGMVWHVLGLYVGGMVWHVLGLSVLGLSMVIWGLQGQDSIVVSLPHPSLMSVHPSDTLGLHKQSSIPQNHTHGCPTISPTRETN